MADEVIKRKKCDNPKCVTPYEDVRRLNSNLEGEGLVVIDVCQPDRDTTPITTIRTWAHRRSRRRGIAVTDPADFRG
jgi:hypothetical protein